MRCKILHQSAGRIRVHMLVSRMTLEQADVLEYYLRAEDGVTDVRVYDRTCDAVIYYAGERGDILSALSRFSFEDEGARALVPDHTSRALNRQYEDRLVGTVCGRAFSRLFIPAPVRAAIAACKAVGYLVKGLRVLARGRLEVAVLDATAITVSMIRGDYNTASSVMFLLRIGETLEEWTHKKSVDDLARTMSLNVDRIWVKTEAGEEILVPASRVRVGDTIVVRTGAMIPLDGKVVSGEAAVNQSSITGEALPVRKECGSYVYAGTVVEEGEVPDLRRQGIRRGTL